MSAGKQAEPLSCILLTAMNCRNQEKSYTPKPGDVVVWWRVSLAGWSGHAGLVHHSDNGILYTIEGNRSDKVAGFDYVLSAMDKLLGFGEVRD